MKPWLRLRRFCECAKSKRAGVSKICSRSRVTTNLSGCRPGRGGSHVIFSAPGVREIVSVPSKRPIKPVYIKHFLALLDAAIEVKQSENQDEAKS